MKMFKLLFAIVVSGMSSSTALADGMSTPFADIQMSGVVLGKPTPIVDVQGHGLRLQNLADYPIRVIIAPSPALPEQLKGGAEKLPNENWLTVSSSEITIEPHSEAEVAVTLTIPNKRAYRKKLFQVMLWSRTIPERDGGVSINAGILSRIRVRTEN